LGHELLENLELALLLLCLLHPGRIPERLRGLDAPLALALKNLQLLVVRERALEILLRRAKAREQQPQRIAALAVLLEHRLLELGLHADDQRHASPRILPPRMCQCK